MRALFRWAIAAVAASMAISFGCSSSDDSGGSTQHPTASESAIAEQSAVATLTAQQTLTVGDAMFRFDPDLDPNGSAAQNLDTIKNNISTDGASCVTITPILGGIKADFGAGCTLGQTGLTLSGAVSVQVEKAEGNPTVTVKLGFETFVVDGFDLDGKATFSTSGGSTLTVSIDLEHAGAGVKADLTVAGTTSNVTVDGSATYTPAGATSGIGLTLTGVVFVPGDCYPSGGTVASGNQALAFDTNTPATGQATLTIGTWSSCKALPAYGSCQVTPCPTKGG